MSEQTFASENKSISMKQLEDKRNPCYTITYLLGWGGKYKSILISVGIKIKCNQYCQAQPKLSFSLASALAEISCIFDSPHPPPRESKNLDFLAIYMYTKPRWKKTSMEDDPNGRRPQWKTNSIEDDLK